MPIDPNPRDSDVIIQLHRHEDVGLCIKRCKRRLGMRHDVRQKKAQTAKTFSLHKVQIKVVLDPKEGRILISNRSQQKHLVKSI